MSVSHPISIKLTKNEYKIEKTLTTFNNKEVYFG